MRTTYVTGMLTRLAEESVVSGFWLRDERRAHPRRAAGWVAHVRRQQPFNRAALGG